MKALAAFLIFAAAACGQGISNPASPPLSNYTWNGVPLTGVSTGSSAVTNVASGNSATLHTAPAGKRSFVFVNFVNPTSTTATYAINKVNGSNSCAIFAAATQTGISQGNVTLASTVLEPGESIQVVVSVAGQMNFVGDWIDFDSSVPLKSPTTYAGFASGDTTLYTVPAGVTALLFPRNALGNPAGVSNTGGVLISDVSVTANLSFKVGGVTWYPSGSFGPSTAFVLGLPGILTTGTTVVINSSVGGQTTGCFVMPTLWERPN